MKKILALMLALMLVLTFAACSGNNDTTEPDADTSADVVDGGDELTADEADYAALVNMVNELVALQETTETRQAEIVEAIKAGDGTDADYAEEMSGMAQAAADKRDEIAAYEMQSETYTEFFGLLNECANNYADAQAAYAKAVAEGDTDMIADYQTAITDYDTNIDALLTSLGA